ncbi:MAG: SH3 domain-containing protein [Anaerolineales bacterium]
MRPGWLKLLSLTIIIATGFLWISNITVKASKLAQIPTVGIPTVTGTPLGVTVVVRAGQDQINVRSGPSTDYPRVGVLIAGQRVPAYGRTPGGDWVQIGYPGVPGGVAWVYSFLVEVSGSLPIVEPPPTPTPLTTPTIDPTLAAQFIVDTQPTRLPTFTPPPQLVIQTFAPVDQSSGTGGVPMGFIIIGLGVIGLFGAVISLLRGR